ncbi:FK506-binding 5-like isoform X1 [Pelobates cultripes]|uniref:FK506-binding 5-like isoform X1 n=2 Tax=Pelobates cultripes TaxID=61616 RepID=A0AAD1QZ06_PELCU|nr:FK506-binding 5-like isoform X1 [Pelobates cultripes]
MAPGNKSKTFKSSSLSTRRPVNSGTKKKKRVKKSAKEKSRDDQQSVRCMSPLVYNPETSLQELMQKYQKETEDVKLKDLHEYESNRQKNHKVAVRMGLSNRISRFEIPMDMKLLESITVQEYLRQYCHVCKRRQKYYKDFFDKFDKDKDGLLSLMETECALNNLYFNEIHPRQVKDLMTKIAAEENSKFDPELFFALCALSERLFYATFVTEDTTDKYTEKQWLETADLSAITWKFAGFNINTTLKNLLDALVYTC